MRVSSRRVMAGAVVAAMFASSGIAFGQTTVDEYQITNDLADQYDPAVRGGKVAFTDLGIAGNGADMVVIDLNAVDLNAGPPYAQERVQPTAGAQHFGEIDGNIVVFTHSDGPILPGGNNEIFYYDLGSNVSTQVTNDTFGQFNPAISGNTIVWEDFRSGSSDIYYFTIGVSTEPAPVTTEAGAQVAPAISGTWVVWQDSATGGDIRGRDLADPTNTIVTIASASQQLLTPDVSGLNVTYAQQQAVGSNNFDIYVTAIGGATIAITTDPADQRHPRISGTRIVWEDYRNQATNGIDLYGFDLSNAAAGAQPLPVVAPAANQFLLDIEGDDVAFTDNRNGNLDIYVLRTTTVVPPSADPCAPDSGAEVLFDETFVRGHGAPVTYNRSFEGMGDTEGTMCVDTHLHVASEITLNGDQVFGPFDFNTSVTHLQQTVDLEQGANGLRVRLVGQPGGTLRVRVVAGVVEGGL